MLNVTYNDHLPTFGNIRLLENTNIQQKSENSFWYINFAKQFRESHIDAVTESIIKSYYY